MKIKVFPADDGACGNYRISWPAQVLIDAGEDVVLHPSVDGHSGLSVMVIDGEVAGIRHPDCDVVVIQRPSHRLYAQSVPFYRRAGIRVVVELDDDLAHIPPSNDAFAAYHPHRDAENNFHWLREACREADTVVCTTPRLAAEYGGANGVVVPNFVPSRYATFRQSHNGDGAPVRVGWAGNLEVHRGDLSATRQGISKALTATGAGFLLVGVDEHLADACRELALHGATPTAATGWFELPDYPKGLAMLDVGLVPLAASAFNEAKSWLKGLELAATGVPFVASDTQPYRSLAAMGIGEIAARPKDWTRVLRQLITDEAFRQDRADTGFEQAKDLTVERNAWRFHEAWAGA